MDAVDTHDLLVSKENIQPLRNGRDTSKLCAALQAEKDSELQQLLEKQRNEFEIKLRSNNSADPLSDWCNYIHWIEQSFPKQPREGKLNIVLKKCLTKFKDNEKYKNDVRFVKLCIKYAEIDESTVELLSQIHCHGIGVKCAELYIAWAEKHVMNNCFKKANMIYERGIENHAEPLELLKEAHQNFHAFLVRRVLNVKEEFKPTFLESAAQESRQPYNVLRPVASGHGDVVSNVRIGPNVKGSPGKLKMSSVQDKKPKSNTCIKIFEDTENERPVTEPTAKLERIPNKKKASKENTVKPGPWCDKQNRKVSFTAGFSNTPFKVHRDEEENQRNDRLQPVSSSVLKSHSGKDYEEDTLANTPLFYPEPDDKTKIVMYCKDQVYAGGLEFQFEELRAIEYERKRKEENLKSSALTDIQAPASEPQPNWVEAKEFFEKPVVESPSEFELNEKIHCENGQKTELLLPDEDIKSHVNLKSRTKRRTMFLKSKTEEQIMENKDLAEEAVPSPDFSMNQTIHTKEALSEMQQLWFSKPASPLLQENIAIKQAGKSILKPARPCFNLYIDESCLDDFKNGDKAEGPLDLTLKSSSNSEFHLPARENLENLNVAVQGHDFATSSRFDCKEIERKLDRLVFTSDDENKENNVPEGYCGLIGKSTRKVTGILTPAENIPVAVPSDPEDDEDVEEDDDIEYCGAAQCNITGVTENLTKVFRFPRNESTPNPRKSLNHRQDVNRSLFECEAAESKNSAYEITTYKEIIKPEEKLEGPTNRIIHNKRSPPLKDENCGKNLSIIVETSREYKSSSSASSSSQIRSFKNYPVTPLDVRCTSSTTVSQSGLNKTKKFSLTGYEASTESTHTGLKSRLSVSEKQDPIKEIYGLNIPSREENLRDTKQMVVEENFLHSRKTPTKELENSCQYIDPFSDTVINGLLKRVEFPSVKYASNLLIEDTIFNAPKVGSCITLGLYKYEVRKLLGEGSYAKVFDITNKATGNRKIAKIQKPPCPWEFYIVKELHLRIGDKFKAESFMNVESAYFFRNASVLLTNPVEYGNLLDAINTLKQNHQLCQLTAIYFTVEILKILETLHSCKIIHADVKPDNFLVMNRNDKPRLQIIDFGRSIDMSLLPEGTTFTKVITTEGFTTTEMRMGKPWTYQVDFYGAANCSHCLLYGDYMTVVEKNGIWNITKTMPRYWAREEWKNYFSKLLNIESCNEIPKISSLIEPFEAILSNNRELDLTLHMLNNCLSNR